MQVTAIILFFFGIWLFLITLRAAKWPPADFARNLSGLLRLFGYGAGNEMTAERQRRWVRGLRTFSILWVLGCLYALLMAHRFFLT